MPRMAWFTDGTFSLNQPEAFSTESRHDAPFQTSSRNARSERISSRMSREEIP